jgi:hypothetical protein
MHRPTQRSVLIITALLSLTAGLAISRGQAPKTQTRQALEPGEVWVGFDGLARELLARPAPTPRLPESELGHTAADRSKKFFDPWKPPPDYAPIADLVDYWTNALKREGGLGVRPSEFVKDRLLSVCETEPRLLDELLPLLPEANGTAERVIRVYLGAAGDESLPPGWFTRVENWLKFNSTFFVNDLVAEAQQVKDKTGGIQHEEALVSLARVDRESAKPLLLSLAETKQVRTEALVLALLFRIAVEDHNEDDQAKYLKRLQTIARDVKAPAAARDAAIKGLLWTNWSGREEWYRSQFYDKTLIGLAEGPTVFSPLLVPVERDPDRWIPLLTELVDGREGNARENAGNCLVQLVKVNPRRDAILPLLPWLEDPRMLRVDKASRTAFILKLGQIEIPECLQALSRVVYFEEENRRVAAKVLLQYKDRRATYALARALDREWDEETRNALIGALLACAGVSVSEQRDDVEAYAKKLTTVEGREQVTAPRRPESRPLSLELAIGKYLANQTDVAEFLASAVLGRANGLRQSDPALAEVMLGIAYNWEVATIDLELLRQIREGRASAEVIDTALKRRIRLRERVPVALAAMAGTKGVASAITAVLLGDEALADRILGSTPAEPKLALLVSARLVQQPLPVRTVAALLKKPDQRLAYAAERYLLAEDSREARYLLWEHSPGQAYVTGWRENLSRFPGGVFATTEAIEQSLREEIVSSGDAPREIYAILGRNQRPIRILRVYRDRTVYTNNESDARYREGPVTVNELAAFRAFVAGRKLTLNGPQFGACDKNCETYEFLAMNRGGARRAVIQTDALDERNIRTRYRMFEAAAKTHYRFEDTIKGVEVLIDDPAEMVRDVWVTGNDLRVRIEHEKSEQDRAQDAQDRAEAALIGAPAVSTAQQALRYKLARRERERLAWYAMRDGKVVGPVARPAAIMGADETDLDLDPQDFSLDSNQRVGLATSGPLTVLAVEGNPWGLWAKYGTARANLLSSTRRYRNPVISADGAWAVAARVVPANWELDYRRPSTSLVRLDLSTGNELPVDLPWAAAAEALAYLPSQGRFLVRGSWYSPEQAALQNAEQAGEPAVSNYYLLDPGTGRVQAVAGNFQPLLQLNRRMLQPTGKPDEYWAAIPAGGRTQVGRYSLKNFSFQPVLTLPYIAFDSMNMWVDEANGKLYFVYEGQLVRLPLVQPSAAK